MCACPQGRGPLWRPGPPGGLHCAVICVCNLWGISVNATLSGWKNLLAHSQFIESTKVQSASVRAFCSPSPRSFPVYTKSMQNSRLGEGAGEGGRELPTPTVLATCLENIQIACVICKPLSHPGGSYISCHYPGGPPIIVSCNNQLQHFIPQARQARSALFFMLYSPSVFLFDKKKMNMSLV